jgi:hypothetical protein
MQTDMKTDARHIETDELSVMAEYAELTAQKRMLEERLNELKPVVTDMVLRESENGEKVLLNGIEFSISRRRYYRLPPGEVEFCFGGNFIPMRIEDVEKELKSVKKRWQKDELLEEEKAILNVKAAR